MWELKTTQPGQEWVRVGIFETVAAAATRILELEDSTSTGVFFYFHVHVSDTDEEAFRVLHCDGRRALYGVRRCRPN
jgi:hypothetical protein